MHEVEFQSWRDLHFRIARGEMLSEEELSRYEEECRELDREESFDGMDRRIAQTRETVAALEAEHRQLNERRQELEREIAALEGILA